MLFLSDELGGKESLLVEALAFVPCILDNGH